MIHHQYGWKQEVVGGHGCNLFVPRKPNPHQYLLIYLHGLHLKKLEDQTKFTALFEKNGLPVVAPVTQRSWWTDRICPEFDPVMTAERYLLDHILPYIEQEFQSSPPRIGLLGTSMGGQGALRFAYKYPDLFPVAAAISPAVDYQICYRNGDPMIRAMYPNEEAARQDTATLHIHPLNWPRHQFFCCDPTDEIWIESSERLRMKLSSLGIPHECDLETTAGGHGFQYYNRMAEQAVCFLVENLERERMRII